MLFNYFKIAIRSINKNRVYSFINILGLSIGVAACLLITLFVFHEFSFDEFHSKADRIYQITGKMNYGGQEINVTAMSSQFGPMVLQNDGGVENFVRTKAEGQAIIKRENGEPFFENRFIFADTSFFSVFSFPLLKGNYHLLSQPNKLIISARASEKYFGNQDPIGKVLTYNKESSFEIVGVAKDPPSNSSIQFDFVASFVTLGTIESEKNQYLHARASLGAYSTYLLLKGEVSKSKVEETMKKVASASVDEKYFLNPLVDQHLVMSASNSNATYLYGFLTIAITILALALINYMSLTTARASLRAKEVGVRKVIGAKRIDLSSQFFFESTLMTITAFILAFAWIEFFLPFFLESLQLTIDLSFIRGSTFISLIAFLFLVCILLSGSYPALLLSKFKPIDTLKGKVSGNGHGAWIRKGFTTTQFAASIGFIFCSLVIGKQMSFMKNQKLGLTKEMVLVVNLDPDEASHYAALKNELRHQSGIVKVASASFTLFNGGTSAFFTQTPTTHEDVFINTINVDDQFFSALDIQWKIKPAEDQLMGKIIVNESGLTKLKLAEEDLGKSLQLGSSKSEIAGVIKDFNFESLHSPVGGMAISIVPDTSGVIAKYAGAMYIRLTSKIDVGEKMKSIQTIFKRYKSNRPFDYYFLDEAFDRLFKSEEQMSKIFNAFTFIAILIACLGLLGLITFTSEVRSKEIGIRKILGANVQNIMTLLTKEYFILIIVSMAIAAPIAWWYLQNWLTHFSYKTEIAWWYIPISTFFALGFAFLTTFYQSIRSAVRNPVESLRSE
ncbi:MAG: ABC transporter permease [Bacteroidetes bacterium]|nr:ABC transporter permease [Bacteroidota bacterium]